MTRILSTMVLASLIAGGCNSATGDTPTATAPAFRACLVQPGDVVLILGDSITADGRYAQIMQDVLDERFPQPDRAVYVVARGNSGWTVRDHLAVLDKHVTAWRPNWVLINLGTNDMGRFEFDEFLDEYKTLITRIRRDTGAKIGLIVPLYVDAEQIDLHKEFEQGIKTLAAEQRCLLIPTQDLYNRVRNIPPATIRFGGDAVHVNELGYRLYAAACLDALDVRGALRTLTWGEREAVIMEVTEKNLTLRATLVSALNPENMAANVGAKFTLPLPGGPLNVTVAPLERLQFNVPRTATPIAIDGSLDDWQTIPVAFELNDPKTQQVSGVVHGGWTMTRAQARLAWDDDGLYVAVEVVTPSLLRSPTGSAWDGDCIEFHLDLRQAEDGKPAPTDVYGQKDAGQIVIGPGPGQSGPAFVTAGSGDARLAKNTLAAFRLTATGYVIEFKLPASQFPGETLSAGDRFRTDLTVSDVERSPDLPDRIQLRLTGSPLSFFNSLEWAVLELQP